MQLSAITCYIASATAVALALGVLFKSPERLTRLGFFAGMLCLGLENLFAALGITANTAVDFVKWESWRLVVMAASISPWLLFSLSYVRGDAREAFLRWRWGLLACFLIPLGFALLFQADFIVSIKPSSFGFLPTLGLGEPAMGVHMMTLVSCVLVLMNMERTFRASIGTLRWRIKFMVLGIAVIFTVRLLSSTHALIFQEFNSRIDGVQSAAMLLASILIFRSLLRAGHFDIQLYPSQSVLKNSVTIVLAGAYLLVAGLSAKYVSTFGLEINYPKRSLLILIAVVILTIGLMSDRLRLGITRFVSRHFQRPLYDYRQIWKQFTEASSSPSGQEELCRRLVRLTADVFQVQTVSIWLYDDHDKLFSLGASTAMGELHAQMRSPSLEEAAALHRFLSNQQEPIEFETNSSFWAAILRRCHPAEFNKGGGRVCCSLLFKGEPIGVLMLGDRIAQEPFGTQDLDMFKCVADHTTSALLNVQLSRQLVQAKELQAFQTMAAFFVHDLKNAASTLNLMLPNLKAHWDTPGFREDALRGISKTVTHINGLVSRLGQLRSELSLQKNPSNLSQLVADCARDLKVKPEVSLNLQLEDKLMATIDPEQINKVLTNLILNAFDALGAGGKIDVRTFTFGNWAVLTVQDTGCGMSQEFMQKKLFRPFQTTKKEGLGIGMFHSRMIVDAHGGRMKVESVQGQGTTFTVLLPKAV